MIRPIPPELFHWTTPHFAQMAVKFGYAGRLTDNPYEDEARAQKEYGEARVLLRVVTARVSNNGVSRIMPIREQASWFSCHAVPPDAIERVTETVYPTVGPEPKKKKHYKSKVDPAKVEAKAKTEAEAVARRGRREVMILDHLAYEKGGLTAKELQAETELEMAECDEILAALLERKLVIRMRIRREYCAIYMNAIYADLIPAIEAAKEEKAAKKAQKAARAAYWTPERKAECALRRIEERAQKKRDAATRHQTMLDLKAKLKARIANSV